MKLKFFKEIAKSLNKFLLVFQTDKPMAAFLAETHEKLLRYFCSKFVRKDVMSKASTVSKLIKIDLNDESNLVLYFGIKYKLKQLKSENPQEFNFKFLIEMCAHLKEKSPLKSVFARSFKCLSPSYMVECSKACEILFQKLLKKLVTRRIFRPLQMMQKWSIPGLSQPLR